MFCIITTTLNDEPCRLAKIIEILNQSTQPKIGKSNKVLYTSKSTRIKEKRVFSKPN